MKISSTVLFLVLFIQVSYGQKLNFKKYSVNNGLPQGQVHDLAQTKDGYMWLATYGGGLVKFDGEQFISYTTKDGLKDNSVEELFVDSDNNLWVATDKRGVAKFRGDSLVYQIKNDSLNHYSVGSIEQFSDGSMWFGTYRGGIFILREQKIIRLTKEDGLPSNTVWDFMESKDGDVWMATQNGVSVYNGHTFENYSTQDGLSGTKAFKIVERKNGEKWIATSNGISIWNGQSFETIMEIDGKRLDYVFDIIEASDGKMWVGTRTHGLYIYEDHRFSQITQKNGLSSNYIYNLFEDRNNHIWVATDEDGVNIYKGQGFTFFNESAGLNDNEVLSIYRDKKDVLWLGTMNGIESFDGQTFTKHPLPDSYENPYIWNITGLPGGDILIHMPDNTLMRFDGQRYTNFSEQHNLEDLYIYDLFIDSSNHLWIGTDSGLYELSLKTHELEHHSREDGLANNTVFYIYEDKKGRKWIGTYYGLNIFDGKDFKTIRTEEGLGHNQVYYITEDENGSMWIGTRGGVSVYTPGKNGEPVKINNFNKKDGMTLLGTHFLWFDKAGVLWQGTNGGLQKLDVPTYRRTGNMPIIHYTLSGQGMGLEFNSKALISDGENAWMGSMKGMVHLQPEKLSNNPLTGLQLTDITVNSLPVDWHNYRDSLTYHNGVLDFPAVQFPPGKKVYDFTFRAMSYFNPDNVKYRYKLKGFDDGWRGVTKDNTATYTNLGAGDYEFIVEATNGKNYSERVSYSFSIANAFWQTYWFYGLLVLFLTALVWGYIRIRIGYLEKDRLKALVDEQTKDLQSAVKEKEVLIKEIHHRVKNNLAVISGLLELQIDYSDNDFASKVLRDSQQRVLSISMIHEKLYQNEKLAAINFSKYITELVDVIARSNSRDDKSIEVLISTGEVTLGIDQGIPCGLIINELLSNAFEHAFEGREAGKIWVEFKQAEGSVIRLHVRDNGVGFPEDTDGVLAESKTLGMVLVQTFIAQLDGSLTVKRPEKGTEFVVEFTKEQLPLRVPSEKG